MPFDWPSRVDPPEAFCPTPWSPEGFRVSVGLVAGIHRIFIVDDDENSRESFAEFLRLSHFDVTEFETGEAALDAVRGNAPAAVVVDITLSGDIDGFECARRLRALSPATAPVVIAMTGHSASVVKKEGVAFDAVLTKPADPDELVATLHRLIPEA
jgi:DNA-binding response OmpR family regulator